MVRLDDLDLGVARDVGEIDGGQFFCLVREDFDPGIDAEVVEGIVGGLFKVEIDVGSARCFGISRHFQLFGAGSWNWARSRAGTAMRAKSRMKRVQVRVGMNSFLSLSSEDTCSSKMCGWE
jgi:hypothetical protein